jgi:hypothetical protein
MTIDGLLTLLALLVAVFTVMSRAQRLNIWLKVRLAHILVICLAVIAIIALELYDALFKLGWVPCSEAWPLKPNEIAFLGVIIGLPIVAASIHFAALPQSRLNRLRNLIEELMKTDQYTEALSLMETHLDRVAQIYQANFLVFKIRKWLESFTPSHETSIEHIIRKLTLSVAEIANEPKSPYPEQIRLALNKAVGKIASRIGRLLPSAEAEQQWATEIFRGTLLNPEYIRVLEKVRPYFGLKVLSLDIYERYDFSDEYFRQLIADRTSILYWEIKNNQNQSGHRYYIPEANRLLWHIFHDAHVAEKLGVWQPIGEQMIAELDRLHLNTDEDRYNDPLGEYRERDQWKCPLYIGIRFFDIMVSEALGQNIQWHMWLYYFTHITEGICRNYHLDPQKADPDAEFPTPYSFLLYEMISTLRNWIRQVQDLPAGQENAVLETAGLVHENGNPIKSSILAVGECLRTILITEDIPPRLKKYLGSIVLNLYFDFVRRDDLSRYAEVIRAVLVSGGLYERSHEDSGYLGEIILALVSNDNVPHRHEDVAQLMSTLVHRFIEKFGRERLSNYLLVELHGDNSVRLSTGRHAYVIEF